MLDTVALHIDTLWDGHPVLPDSVTPGGRNGPYPWGTYGNLRIKTTPDGVLISGSLAVFQHGNNFDDMTREDVRCAIRRLGDALGLPVDQAHVYRFDVGANIRMDHPVSHYLPLLYHAPGGYRKFMYEGETVGFRIRRRALVFYDKIQEATIKKKEIPDAYVDAHVLRYEMQMKSRVREQHHQTVYAEMLCDPGFFEQMVRRWEWEYRRIEKHPSFNLNGHVTDIKKDVALAGIEARGGMDAFAAHLDRARSESRITRQQQHTLRRWSLSLRKSAEEDGLIQELDFKIRQMANHLLQP